MTSKSSLLYFACCTSLLYASPALADTFITFSQPTTTYTSATTDFGGGDASGSTISKLGPFTLSTALTQDSVPNGGWNTWNAPPAVEGATPNVLSSFLVGATSLTISVAPGSNLVGFEYEPNLYLTELVSAAFYNENNALIDTEVLSIDGFAGTMLFALEDTTPGQTISSISLSNTSQDQFGLAQLRAGEVLPVATTPEPSTLSLMGTGLVGLLAATRRRFAR